jgi:hypothetical protein
VSPVGPDRSQSGSPSSSVPDRCRFVAIRIPTTRQHVPAFGLVMALFLLFAVSLVRPVATVPNITYIRPVLLVGGFVVGFLIYRRLLRKKVVISVAAAGLSIDQRAGDVFSFQDTQLGQWRAGRRGSGRALVLVAGSHRFVLGERGSLASGVPLHGPQVDVLDLEAWMKPQTLDELVAVVDHWKALAVCGPAPAQPPAQTTSNASLQTRRPLNWWVLIPGVLSLLVFVWVGLRALSDSWYPAYQYELGTPTTATIDHCDQSSGKGHLIWCTGTWTVNGRTQSGLINNGLIGGNRTFVAGSSLAVHVKDGIAYTAHTMGSSILPVVFFGLVLIGGCALFIRGVWSVRRAR